MIIMGVVNVTPNSFSDGGQFFDPTVAIAHGLQLRADGAAILDVGGEATNPRAQPITAAEELRRVLPVIAALARAGATVSIDTTKAVVAREAVAAGATIVNDVSGGLFDPDMAQALDELPETTTYIAGHLRGRSLAEVFAAEAPTDWRDVGRELADRLAALSPSVRARAWIDPGIGFGKGSDPATNLSLLRHAGDLGALTGCATVVVGPSRKRFLARLVGDSTDPEAIDHASASACLLGKRFGAQIARVHNVTLLRNVLAVYTSL